MTLSNTADFELYRGELVVFTVTAANGAGTAINLTGCTIKFAVRPSLPVSSVISDADATIAKTSATAGQIDITDPTNGIFTITITSADTNTIDLGKYPHEMWYGIEYWDNSGDGPYILGVGKFLIYPEIVRAALT